MEQASVNGWHIAHKKQKNFRKLKRTTKMKIPESDGGKLGNSSMHPSLVFGCACVWMGILLLKRKPKKNDERRKDCYIESGASTVVEMTMPTTHRRRHRTENEKNRLRIGFVMLSDCACKNQSHKATPLKTQ